MAALDIPSLAGAALGGPAGAGLGQALAGGLGLSDSGSAVSGIHAPVTVGGLNIGVKSAADSIGPYVVAGLIALGAFMTLRKKG